MANDDAQTLPEVSGTSLALLLLTVVENAFCAAASALFVGSPGVSVTNLEVRITRWRIAIEELVPSLKLIQLVKSALVALHEDFFDHCFIIALCADTSVRHMNVLILATEQLNNHGAFALSSRLHRHFCTC